jgi:hypothetical protein
MATNLEFPMTLRMSALRTAGILAIGALFIGCSFLLFGAEGTTRVSVFGRVPKHDLAYFFFILGVAIVLAMVQAFISERPALALNTDGFVFRPLFGSVRRLPWPEVAEITSRSSKYERCVVVRTRAGQVQKIPAFQGSAEEMCYIMQRCAEVAAAAHKEAKRVPASAADCS